MKTKALEKIFELDVGIKIIDKMPMFEINAVSIALGYITRANGKDYAHKTRVLKILDNAEIVPMEYHQQKYINIDDVRKLITLCHTDTIYKDSFIKFLQSNGYVSYKEVFSYTRKEINFFNLLDKVLFPMKISAIRQYTVSDTSYRIDYYIECLKLAIEYDENNHRYYTYEQQENRQSKIEKILGCKFIRISDLNDNYTNIGIIMSHIMQFFG